MNYIKTEDVKAYVEKNPAGIAGTSENLTAMVNHFAEQIVRECAKCITTPTIAAMPPDDRAIKAVIDVLARDMCEHFGVD